MEASIFSNLPNNLIMKIIKMNTEQELINLQKHYFGCLMMELEYYFDEKNNDWFGEYHSDSESDDY